MGPLEAVTLGGRAPAIIWGSLAPRVGTSALTEKKYSLPGCNPSMTVDTVSSVITWRAAPEEALDLSKTATSYFTKQGLFCGRVHVRVILLVLLVSGMAWRPSTGDGVTLLHWMS